MRHGEGVPAFQGLTASSLRLGPPRVNGALKQGSQVYAGSFATQ